MCHKKEIPQGHKECDTCGGKGEAVFSCCSGEVVSDDIMLCPECYEHLGEEECTVPEEQTEFTDKAPSLQSQAEAHQEAKRYGEN